MDGLQAPLLEPPRHRWRMAPAGSALGVDISGPAIERARELTGAQGVRNVAFERADAQVCRFSAGAFRPGVSRFGTMFFADPVAAFTNIGRALPSRAAGDDDPRRLPRPSAGVRSSGNAGTGA